MAYTINKTDGTVFATVADGTTNTDSSVTIIGKNYAGYGEFLGENFIKLLENSAASTPPSAPLTGQVWFNSSASTVNNVSSLTLGVYNGTAWKNLGSATTSATAPSTGVTGDLWFDSTNTQLKVYNGSSWTLVGPAFTSGTGTSGAIVDTITDDSAVPHVVVKMFVEDTIVAMVSKDATFTPGSAVNGNWGTAAIKPGVQLNSAVSNALFQGEAADSALLDGIDSSGFLKSSENDETSGTLKVQNDSGFYVGEDDDLAITVNGSDIRVTNVNTNGNLVFRVNNSQTGLTIDGATNRLIVAGAPTVDLGVATKKYVDDSVSATSNALLRDGSNTITGSIIPDGDNSRNFGASGTRFATIYATTFNGTATTAEYADLAERFEADAEYEAGTVVSLGGVAEVTQAVEELSEDVFGVVSDRAAYLMNAGAGSDATHPPIAMNGRVPVKVVGTVNKGDRLVSAGNGFARAAKDGEATARNIIGRALQTKTTEEAGTVEAVVKINF
jgi:hypothetical protein